MIHLLCWGLLLQAGPVLAQMRIGLVRSEQIMARVEGFPEARADFEAFEKGLDQLLETKENEFDNRLEQYLRAKQVGMDEEENAEMIAWVEKAEKAYEQQRRDNAARLRQRYAEQLEPFVRDYEIAVEEVAERLGLDYVFGDVNAAGTAAILYGSPALYIDADVAKELKQSGADQPGAQNGATAGGLVGFTNAERLMEMYGTQSKQLAKMDKAVGQLSRQLGKLEKEYERKAAEYERKRAEAADPAILREMALALTRLDAEMQALIIEGETKTMEVLDARARALLAAIAAAAAENGIGLVLNETMDAGISSIVIGPEENEVSPLIYPKLGLTPAFRGNEGMRRDMRIGYADFEEILLGMPDFVEVGKQLEAFSTQLADEMVAGSATDADLMARLEAKEAELMAPVLARVQEVVIALAAEQQFQMVLNQSRDGSMLYARPEYSLTKTIRQRLAPEH